MVSRPVTNSVGPTDTKPVVNTTPPPINPGVIGYTSGFDQNGNRYQTPIYANQQKQQDDVPNPFSQQSTSKLSTSLIDSVKPDTTQTDIQKAQTTALGNGLIDLSNKQIQAKNDSINQENQIITQVNKNNLVNNAIDKLANGDIAQHNQIVTQLNNNAKIDNGIAKLANSDIIQKNQLIQQSNVNNAIDNALGKLSVETYITNAKNQGVKSFDIIGPSAIGGAFGSQGTKIGTTTPENAINDLASFQAKGIPVSLSYVPLVAKPAPGLFDVLKSDIKESPIGDFARGIVAGIGATNARSEVQTPFTGLTNSVKEGSTNLVPGLSVFATKIYQPPTQIDNGFLSSNLLQKNPQYVAGGLASLVISGGLQVGAPGVGKVPGLVSDLLKSGAGKGIVSDIATAASKGENTIAPQIEKVSSGTYRITLGTEGRSITPTQKFTKLLDIFRTPTQEKNIPGFGTIPGEKYAEISKGFTDQPLLQPGKVGANEIGTPKITQPIGNLQGESAISDVFVSTGKNGVVTYVPKTISEDVKPTSILIDKNVPDALQTRLGLTPFEGNPDLLIGKLTPETRLILRDAENNGLVSKVGQGFSFPLSDVTKSPDLYSAVAKNPSLLGESGTALQDKILPEVTRPDITAIYQTTSKGFESGKGLNVYKGIQYGSKGEDYLINNLATLNFKPIINPVTGAEESLRGFGSKKSGRPTKSKPVNFGGEFTTTTPEKIGAGANGKANSLINEARSENVFKDLYKEQPVQKEEKVGTYLGLSPPITKSKQTQETEIISFPPGTKSELMGKQMGLQGLKIESDILQDIKTKQDRASRSSTLSKLGSELSTRQNNQNLLKTITISGQRENQRSRFDLGSLLSTKQSQGGIFILRQDVLSKQTTITTPDQTTKPTFGLRYDVLPIPVQTTRLIPVPKPFPIPTPERTPLRTPLRISFPDFNFTFGGVGGNRHKKTGSIKSYFAYSVNPGIVGAIEQAGIQGLQASRSDSVYLKVDKQLQRATRLQGKIRL